MLFITFNELVMKTEVAYSLSHGGGFEYIYLQKRILKKHESINK